MGVSEKHETA